MPSPLLVCRLPNGAPVLDYAPDEFPLARLHAYLAQPDEAQVEALTVLSLPAMAVQEEAPTTLEAIGAEAEAGRQPIIILP
jgi:hypothetical protein